MKRSFKKDFFFFLNSTDFKHYYLGLCLTRNCGELSIQMSVHITFKLHVRSVQSGKHETEREFQSLAVRLKKLLE